MVKVVVTAGKVIGRVGTSSTVSEGLSAEVNTSKDNNEENEEQIRDKEKIIEEEGAIVNEYNKWVGGPLSRVEELDEHQNKVKANL